MDAGGSKQHHHLHNRSKDRADGFHSGESILHCLYTVNVRSWRKTEIAEALVPNP
jgi:hypothetical protein